MIFGSVGLWNGLDFGMIVRKMSVWLFAVVLGEIFAKGFVQS